MKRATKIKIVAFSLGFLLVIIVFKFAEYGYYRFFASNQYTIKDVALVLPKGTWIPSAKVKCMTAPIRCKRSFTTPAHAYTLTLIRWGEPADFLQKVFGPFPKIDSVEICGDVYTLYRSNKKSLTGIDSEFKKEIFLEKMTGQLSPAEYKKVLAGISVTQR